MKKYLIALLVIACNIGNQGKVFANTSNDGNVKKVNGVYVFGYERDMSDNVNFEEYPDGRANSVYWKDGIGRRHETLLRRRTGESGGLPGKFGQ